MTGLLIGAMRSWGDSYCLWACAVPHPQTNHYSEGNYSKIHVNNHWHASVGVQQTVFKLFDFQNHSACNLKSCQPQGQPALDASPKTRVPDSQFNQTPEPPSAPTSLFRKTGYQVQHTNAKFQSSFFVTKESMSRIRHTNRSRTRLFFPPLLFLL